MKTITYAAFRQKLKSYLDGILTNHTALCISYNDGHDVVILSKAEYNSMEETFYLLKSPANAVRLLKSIEDYKNGLGKERGLIED